MEKQATFRRKKRKKKVTFDRESRTLFKREKKTEYILAGKN